MVASVLLAMAWHDFLAVFRIVPYCKSRVASDTAGAGGFEAYYQTQWFSGLWTSEQVPLLIAYNELFPVVIAVHV